MRYGFIGIAVALALLAGCVADTKNVRLWRTPGPLPPPRGPDITFYASNGWYAGESATLTATWQSFYSPFTISVDMGGGTTENVAAGTPASNPFTHVFTLVEGDYNYRVTLTDANGQSGVATGWYSVGPPLNRPPSIDEMLFENGVLSVLVSDPDGDVIYVSISAPSSLDSDDWTRKADLDSGIAKFDIWPIDIMAGGKGPVVITVEDNRGGTDTMEYDISIDPIVIPAGALAAVPVRAAVQTGYDVTVVVVAGEFAQPFHYMNSVGVTVDKGATFVDMTLNPGAQGGDQRDVDGLWSSVAPDAFLLPVDFMIQENDIGGGRVRIDFNVTPIGGHETTNGGALFNFGLSFDHAGTYALGFEEFHDVKRTYYSDSSNAEHNWEDISNDHPDVPNSIEVT